MKKPILYSLQHCPYAMRARLALLMARQVVSLRAIVTKDKPADMLAISPKGTVPILILSDGTIIDESLDIMIWALKSNDPDDLLYSQQPELYSEMLELISESDNEFRTSLSAYKYNKRYHLADEIKLRSECELFIQKIESMLTKQMFIMGDKLSFADLAILPFVRQFANTDKKWFRDSGYPKVTAWLAGLMQSLLFTKAMRKYPLWLENNEEFLFFWDRK
jgi:glutathione S-transferase